MKRLALLFLSLLLLCGCAPQMGEEKPSFSPPTLEEERGETTEGEAVVHPLDQKILLDFDSREEFATDSVRVTLKASASDHLDPPTKEDFPGIDLSRIEYLVTGGYDMEKGKDWDTYFSIPERKPEHFRWRLRLYFEEPGEQTARDAVDVLNKMPEVAEIENGRVANGRYATTLPFDRDGLLTPHANDALVVFVEADYSDPHVPYAAADFCEISATEVSVLLSPPFRGEHVVNEMGVCEEWLSETERNSVAWQGKFYRILAIEFEHVDDETLAAYAEALLTRPDIELVQLNYYHDTPGDILQFVCLESMVRRMP